MTILKIYKNKLSETVKFIKSKLSDLPQIGLMTGTGLGDSAELMEITASLEYKDIPNFPVSTVQSHTGRLFFGKLHGKNIMALQGRFHLYEGYSPLDVIFPIRIMQNLGVKTLILSNASGGLNPAFKAGRIMIINDHINLTGENPLIGPNEDTWGIRFPDMTNTYDNTLKKLANKAANKTGIDYGSGVYAGLKGPSLETPAEMRYLRTIGADAVGFSTIMEVIAAVHAGIKVLGLSIITNIANPNNPVPATVDEIIETAQKAAPGLEAVVKKVIEEL
ncbi:Purine nucleoside phosphorylase 1 [Candidatus Magnetomoraceae bacterium gMMP-1]